MLILYDKVDIIQRIMLIAAIIKHCDITIVVTNIFGNLINTQYCREYIDAVMVFMYNNVINMHILPEQTKLFISFEFYDLLNRVSHLRRNCYHHLVKINIGGYTGEAVIEVVACDCNDDDLFDECNSLRVPLNLCELRELLIICHTSNIEFNLPGDTGDRSIF